MFFKLSTGAVTFCEKRAAAFFNAKTTGSGPAVPLLMNGRQHDKRSIRSTQNRPFDIRQCTITYGALNDVKCSTTTRDGHPGSRTVAAFVRGFLPGYARLSVGLQTNNLSRFRRTHRFQCRTPMARVGGAPKRSRPKRNEKRKKIHRLRQSCVLNVPSIPGGDGHKTDLDRNQRGFFFCGIFQIFFSTSYSYGQVTHFVVIRAIHLTTSTLSSIATIKYKLIVACVAILPQIS